MNKSAKRLQWKFPNSNRCDKTTDDFEAIFKSCVGWVADVENLELCHFAS